jgi:thiamine-phosphate pyrophosphorylase
LLSLVERAVAARISLVQLREKKLTARTLYELARRAAAITERSATRLLINDRTDIARAAGADGVHLTTQSLDVAVVRSMTDGAHPATINDSHPATIATRPATHADVSNSSFLIGVSAHTIAQARAARDGGADFAVLGPIFDTPSKRAYGSPLGLQQLTEAARDLAPFPLLALGGVNLENARHALLAGAHGVAAIRLFADTRELVDVVRAIREAARDARQAERD